MSRNSHRVEKALLEIGAFTEKSQSSRTNSKTQEKRRVINRMEASLKPDRSISLTNHTSLAEVHANKQALRQKQTNDESEEGLDPAGHV